MTGLNHTLAGAAIALILPPPLALPLAFLSHFVLDMVPHFGRHPKFVKFSPHLKALIIADGAVSVGTMSLIILLSPDKWLSIGLCCFLAVLPDLLWIFQKLLHTPVWFLKFSSWIQWGERPYGWIYETAYTILGLGLIIGIMK
jgi:hypothetical protein